MNLEGAFLQFRVLLSRQQAPLTSTSPTPIALRLSALQPLYIKNWDNASLQRAKEIKASPARFYQRRSFHSTKVSVEGHHSYLPHPVMSQEHLTDTRQRPLPGAVMASQKSPFIGPTPNMLPPNLGGTFERSTASSQAFSPSIIIPHDQILLPKTLAHWPSFPNLIYPFASPYPDLKAHRAQHPLPLNMSHNEHNSNTGQRDMNPKPPATPSQGYNLTSPSEQRHDSVTKGNTVHFSPTSSLPPGWKGSRLPSNNVSRKTPLVAHSSDNRPPFIAQKIPKVQRQRSVSQPKPSGEASQANRIRQQRSFNTPSGVPKRGRPRLDDGIQDDNTAENSHGRGGYNTRQRSNAQPPIGLYAPPQVSSTTTTPRKASRPRPRYDYQVPLELEGTRMALGEYSMSSVSIAERLR